MSASKDAVAQWHRATWQVASLLLGYPDGPSASIGALVRTTVASLPAAAGGPLDRFLHHAETVAPEELAAEYVETFDHRRRCCPYLTYFAHGDTRKRGMALLRFKQAYAAAGLVLSDDELPDHLAVVLEFAATGDPERGRRLLLEHRAGLEVLRMGLQDAGSAYADVVRAVCATLPQLAGDEREAVARLVAEGPPEEEVGLDPFAVPSLPNTVGARR